MHVDMLGSVTNPVNIAISASLFYKLVTQDINLYRSSSFCQMWIILNQLMT